MKRNPIYKVAAGWIHQYDGLHVKPRKSWGFTCPQCGLKFKWPMCGQPWDTRKQARDALHAHLSGNGTRIVCKGGQVETATG